MFLGVLGVCGVPEDELGFDGVDEGLGEAGRARAIVIFDSDLRTDLTTRGSPWRPGVYVELFGGAERKA